MRFAGVREVPVMWSLIVPKKLISVVDDDESTRKSTTLLIESFGFQAAGFGSADSLLKSRQLQELVVSSHRYADARHEWVATPKTSRQRRL